jgi:hypothetical protein
VLDSVVETAVILRQVGNRGTSQCFGEVKGELSLKVKVKVKGHVGSESFVDPRTCTVSVSIFVVSCYTNAAVITYPCISVPQCTQG